MEKNKKSDPDKEIQPVRFERGFVTLPFEPEEFSQFISSLLGKPQTITKQIPGCFEIEMKDLENLYYLVDQRIGQQNKARLIQFRSKIIFSDDSTVLLTSLNELITYNEVRPVVSLAVHLTWEYLVVFEDKVAPEKQEIEVSIISTDGPIPFFDDFMPSRLPMIRLGSHGFFQIRIKHTARTWGADIESLLSNQVKNLIKARNKTKEFVFRRSDEIGTTFGVLFFLSAILTGLIVIKNFSQNKAVDVVRYLSGTQSIDSLNSKINFLVTNSVSGEWPEFYFKLLVFLFIAGALSFVFSSLISSRAETPEPSFILLTKESYKKRDRIKEKLKRRWIMFFVSIGLSIITGIISNFIFSKIP